MSKLLHKCNACSDIHATTFPTAISSYAEDAQNGIFSVCCGDFLVSTGGLFNADNTPTKNLIKQFVALNGGVVVGNHDAGQHSTMPRESWETLTGQDLLSEKIIDGVHYIFVSGNKAGGALGATWDDGKPIYPEDVRTQTISLLTAAKAANQRCIVLTHYPLEQGTTDGNGFAFRVGQPRGTGTPYKPKTYTSTGYFAKDSSGHTYDTDFYNQIATFDNVLWLSGHTHVNWKYQSGYNDGVNITEAGVPIPYPNQKVYKVPNGAAMINLPSANYQSQDARIEVYNDRVIVRARESGIELGGEYNYTWYTDGSLVKNAPEPSTEHTVYNITVTATGCTISGPSTIMEGEAATLMATTADGYALPESVSVTGASYTWDKATGTLVLSSPIGAVHVAVTAKKLPSVYNITVEASGCAVSGDTTIIENATATITLSPFAGYTLPATISVTNATYTWNINSGVITLSNPTGPVTISASAIKIPITYSISINAHNCTVTGATTIKEGSTATLIATAHEDYILPPDVSVVGAQYTWNTSTGTLVLSNPTSNVSITITAIEVVTDNYTITYHLTHCSSTSQPTTIGRKQSVVLTLVASDGYALPTTITSYNASSTWNKVTGQLVLYNAIGNVIITAIGTALPSNATNIPIYTKELVQILTRSEVWRLDGVAQPIKMYTKKLVEIIFNNESYSNFITTTGTFITKDGDVFRVVEVDANTPVNAAKSLDGYTLMSSDGQYLLIKEDSNV